MKQRIRNRTSEGEFLFSPYAKKKSTRRGKARQIDTWTVLSDWIYGWHSLLLCLAHWRFANLSVSLESKRLHFLLIEIHDFSWFESENILLRLFTFSLSVRLIETFIYRLGWVCLLSVAHNWTTISRPGILQRAMCTHNWKSFPLPAKIDTKEQWEFAGLLWLPISVARLLLRS